MESLISALSAPSLLLPLSPHLHLSSFPPLFSLPLSLSLIHLFFLYSTLFFSPPFLFSSSSSSSVHSDLLVCVLCPPTHLRKNIPPPLSLRHAHHVALPLGITARDLKVVPIHRELSVTEWAPFTSVMKISQETLWVATTFGDLCIFALLACFVFFSVKCLTTRLTHSVPPLLDDVAQRRQCTERMQIHTLCK